MSTAVVTARETDTVGSLWREMRRAGVRDVPVVDERQHVVGIVSERDLARAASRDAPLGGVMVRHVVTVRAGERAERAMWTLVENGFRALPVIGDGEQLVGMVRARDLRDSGAARAA